MRWLSSLRIQRYNAFIADYCDSSIPKEEADLLNQSRKLYTAWTKFCQQLPEEQRKELAGEAPSLRLLFSSVKKASMTWHDNTEKKNTGRLKQIFANLCNNVKDHSTLLSVIPSGDKYVCLITGSLSAIAQVRKHPFIIRSHLACFLFFHETACS